MNVTASEAESAVDEIGRFLIISGYSFEGPHSQDYNSLGSTFGSINLGKLPFKACVRQSLTRKVPSSGLRSPPPSPRWSKFQLKKPRF